MGLVKNSGDVQDLLRSTQGAVAFNVAGHTINDVGHGHTVVGVVGIVVDNRGLVDRSVNSQRE